MRKMNWLVGSIALGIGLVIGMVGYALAITPVDGDSRLVNFWRDNDVKPAASTLQNPGTQGSSTQNPSDLNLMNPYDPSGLGTTGTDQNGYPGSGSGEGTLPTQGTTVPGLPSNGIPTELAQKIIADYKQDVGLLFEAWKSSDMMGFRSKLMKAYKGDLYENHARQAEGFIAQGIGIHVSDIGFDQVTVESATATSATLTASYHYVAQDYDIGEQTPSGETTEHQVKVRVNMIKDNSRWLITGETVVQ